MGADGNAHMDHYPFDKLVCGLVDLARYANHPDAAKTLARMTAYADKTFQRALAPLADITDNQAYYGLPQEWYTLCGESVSRVPAYGRRDVPAIRGRVAVSRVLGQVRGDRRARGRARRARLQPRQHVQQRGDGVRRHG